MSTSRTTRAIVGVSATAGWIASLTTLRTGDVFFWLGLYGLGVILAVLLVDGARVRELLRPSRRVVFVGLGAGLIMAGLTHLGWALVVLLLPSLQPPVAELFALFWSPPGPVAQLHWLLVIVVAEELLWRGLWPTLVEARSRPWLGTTVVVAVYAIGQSGSGSPLVVALAIGCGVVWLVLRMWTRSLWPPLLTHILWNLLVLVWFPLE
jgi:membrane protease YdiL (CAAX protease family)